MNPQKLKKLEKLAKVLDGGDVELLTLLDNLEEKTEKEIQAIHNLVVEALAVAEQTKKLEGKQGEPGYAPVKNKDYFDGKDGYTPIKGVDYVDGVDGRTPIFIGNKEPRNPQKGDLWYRD